MPNGLTNKSLLGFFVFFAVVAYTASLTALYEVVDLGTVTPDTISLGVAINDKGVAAATSIRAEESESQAFVNLGNGEILPLERCDITFSAPKGLNNNGFVVGRVRICDGPIAAFAWNPGSSFHILPSPYGRFTSASAINDQDEIAGTADIDPCHRHAIVWYPESDWVDLGTLGGQFSNAAAINNKGAVAGRAGRADSEAHAFYWTKAEGMKDLGTLGGPLSGARGMNDKGWVVGYAANECQSIHAFLWRGGGVLEAIDRPDTLYSIANDVNDQGQVVGVFRTDSFHKAFLWTAKEGLVDLHSLISPEAAQDWRLHSAKSINERGEIVGIGQLNGHYRGFLLIPTAGAVARPSSCTKCEDSCSVDRCTVKESECSRCEQNEKPACDAGSRCGASEEQCDMQKAAPCRCGG